MKTCIDRAVQPLRFHSDVGRFHDWVTRPAYAKAEVVGAAPRRFIWKASSLGRSEAPGVVYRELFELIALDAGGYSDVWLPPRKAGPRHDEKEETHTKELVKDGGDTKCEQKDLIQWIELYYVSVVNRMISCRWPGRYNVGFLIF